MKTRLYVAGIVVCLLLLIAIYKPFVEYTSTTVAKTTSDLSSSRPAVTYEQAAIPGLELKTPAKVAIVNKQAVAEARQNRKKMKEAVAKAAASRLKKEQDAARTKEKSDELLADLLKEEARLENLHPYVATSNSASRRVKNQPEKPSVQVNTEDDEVLVNVSPRKEGRKVIDYNTSEDEVVNTSYSAAEKVSSEATVMKVESVAKVEKKEKVYSFRGKTSVKSSLYKYIPPFWDGFSPEIGNESADRNLVITKAKRLVSMAQKGGYNADYAFLVDMSVKSNRHRFFIVNLKTMRIEKSALVAQGRGRENLNLDKEYSNVPGSNCSSLGVYKIGQSYHGAFGLSYRLHGLESSNSNALKRYIVLHAMGTVPEVETNFPIWQSEGCPSVNPAVLEQVGNMINNSKKPILMWMYDDTYIPVS